MVKFLHAKGWNVIGTYLSEGAVPFPRLPNLRFTQCDLRNGQRVTQVLNQYQPTHIFHFAAQSLPLGLVGKSSRDFRINIMGSLYLFEAIRHLKRRPVVVSACSAPNTDMCRHPPFRSLKNNRFGHYIPMALARFVWTC